MSQAQTMPGTATEEATRSRQVGGDHYTRLAVQPWEAMRAWLEPAEYIGYMRGNAIKYLARLGAKGGSPYAAVEDAKKASHYLDELILELEAEAAAGTDRTRT
jgi:hypothetical protein